ncbi:hypothetical protein [Streptomyces malaysiensis]
MRYTLRDPGMLRKVMQYPGRGAPYSIRELAEAIELKHHSLVGHLLTGERDDCDSNVAHAIAGALGVAVLVLFAPPTSPDSIESSTE